jgi:hypothetical protein
MNRQNVILSHAALVDFLRAQLASAEVVAPADMVIAAVVLDGERVLFQCRSASWPAPRGFRKIPVFFNGAVPALQRESLP